MKILIITPFYAPLEHPRPHRWTALAEYWAAKGYWVTVLTSRQAGLTGVSIENGVEVVRAGYDRPGARAVGRVKSRGRWPIFLRRVYEATWKNICFPDEFCLWNFTARKALRATLNHRQFDVMISVSMPFTGHLPALWLKRQYPQLPWIADVGDPFAFGVQAHNNKRLYNHLSLKTERTVLRSADAVSLTTEATLHRFAAEYGPDFSRRCAVIPPLLHPCPEPIQPDETIKRQRKEDLRLVYVGALYAPMRSAEVLKYMLEALDARYPGITGRMKIEIYGKLQPGIEKELKKIRNVVLFGEIGRGSVGRVIAQADVLLNFGNRSDYQLPSKTVEYYASGKPVLHLAEIKNDPFEAFFAEYPAFLSFDACATIDQIEALHAWLTGVKKGNNLLWKHPDITRFKLENVANRYEDIISSVILNA